MRFGPAVWAAATTVIVALSACSSSEEAGAEATGDGSGVTQLTVAAIEIADYAPVFYALENGFFDDEGLDVTITPIPGGAAAVPLLVNGEAQIGSISWISYIQAVSEGLDLRAVLPGAEAAENFSGIVALPESGITSPGDLAGKRVAVNAVRGLAELTARAALDEGGVDSDSVVFLELPLPDMGASLANGNVDAAWVVEPFLAGLRANGAELVLDVYAGHLDGLPLGGWTATEEFAADNPETVEAFARAMAKAVEALADDATFVEFLPTYTALTPEQASGVTLPALEQEISEEELQEEADLMTEYGLLDAPVDIAATLDHLRALN